MPLSAKGRRVMANMKKEYGDKAEKVFYASKNKGTISGVEAKESLKKAFRKMRGK